MADFFGGQRVRARPAGAGREPPLFMVKGDDPKGATGRAPFGGAGVGAIAASLAFILAVTAIFLAFPAVDLWFTGLFYADGGGFFLRGNDALAVFRRSGDIAVVLVVVFLVGQLWMKLANPERPSLVPPSITVFLLSTLVLGPLLVVNIILKDHWGRPRPTSVDAFGGEAPYVEVWRITGYCDDNCSFVAGEASTAMWLVVAALMLPAAVRLPVVLVTGVFGVLLSFNRIALGGHFLSDVLLSWGITLLVAAVVWQLVVKRPPAWLAGDRLESGLTGIGRRLRRRPAGSGERSAGRDVDQT